MFVYYVLIGVPLALAAGISLTHVKFSKESLERMIPVDAFFGILLLLLAVRGIECGIDLENYLSIYKTSAVTEFHEVLEAHDLEWGYHFLQYTLAQAGLGFRVMIALTSVLSVVPIWIVYRRNTGHAYLTVILFATVTSFSMLFSGIRQSIAIAIVMLAYLCVRKKRLIGFILLVALASLFHVSAWIALLIYPVYYLPITRNWLWFLAPSMCVLFVFRQAFFRFALMMLGEKYVDRYGVIQDTGAYMMLVLLVAFLIFTFVLTREKEIDAETRGLRNLMLVMVIIQFFASINAVAMRMNYYFLIFLPLLIPRVIERAPRQMRQLARLALAVLCIFFTYHFFHDARTGADVLKIFPYISMWEG